MSQRDPNSRDVVFQNLVHPETPRNRFTSAHQDRHPISINDHLPLSPSSQRTRGTSVKGTNEETNRHSRFVRWSLSMNNTTILLITLLLAPGAAVLAYPPDRNEEMMGFVALSDGKTFDHWEQDGNWIIEEGAFYRKKNGGPLTYTAAVVPDDFELRFEWKVSKGCNSGVYYRPGQVEYQVLDNVNSSYGENARQAAASLFFCMAPKKDATRPLGEWNTARILCKGSVIEHWLNDERVLSFDYTDPKWADYVKLLGIRGGNLTGRGGKLWLQDHGQDVWFRHLRWRTIPENEPLTPDPDFLPMPVTGAALEKEEARVRAMLEKMKPPAPRDAQSEPHNPAGSKSSADQKAR